jgi:hypothetical protein
MPKRDVAIEIIQPTKGINRYRTESMIEKDFTPKCEACNAFYGIVQKDYGTTIFATGTGAGLGAPANLLFKADFSAATLLQAFTHTGMYKYTSGLDSFVADSPSYSGTYTDFWSAAMHNDVMIYDNGINLLQAKTSYSSTGTVMGGVSVSSYKAWGVVSFADHLNIYHTVESGNECPKRIRWTKAGTLSYATSDWTTGTAGFVDLQDMDGDLQQAEKIGNAGVAIYGEGSIHMQEWVGGTDVYRFTKMITNKGVSSRRSVVSNDTIHYVFSNDFNVYEYAGGRSLRSIGDAVKPDILNTINQNALQYAWTQYVSEDDELRIHIPTGTSTHTDTVYICKVNDEYAWFRSTQHYNCAGELPSRPSGVTIGELVGNIGAQNWRFGDYYLRGGSRVRVMGDMSGRVVKMDKTVYSISESGSSLPQTFSFDTKDLSSISDIDPLVRDKYNLSSYMDNQTRWVTVKAELKGQGSAYLQYSTDGGNTFTNFDESPITLDANWKMHTLDLDRCSEKMLVRLSNSSTNEVVHMRYMKIQFIPGGDVE